MTERANISVNTQSLYISNIKKSDMSVHIDTMYVNDQDACSGVHPPASTKTIIQSCQYQNRWEFCLRWSVNCGRLHHIYNFKCSNDFFSILIMGNQRPFHHFCLPSCICGKIENYILRYLNLLESFEALCELLAMKT